MPSGILIKCLPQPGPHHIRCVGSVQRRPSPTSLGHEPRDGQPASGARSPDFPSVPGPPPDLGFKQASELSPPQVTKTPRRTSVFTLNGKNPFSRLLTKGLSGISIKRFGVSQRTCDPGCGTEKGVCSHLGKGEHRDPRTELPC